MNRTADLLHSTTLWIGENSLQSSLFILAVLLLAIWSGTRMAPKLRCFLWILVGLRLILPIDLESRFSVWNLAVPISLTPSLPIESVENAPAILLSETDPLPVSEKAPADGISENSALPFSSYLGFHLLSWIWLVGFLSLVIFAYIRHLRTRREILRLRTVDDPKLRQLLQDCLSMTGIRYSISLTENRSGTGIAIFGFLRPTHLLIPSDFSDQYQENEIRAIFLHEAEHIRRHDMLWNWATFTIQAIHWFNPLVWIAGRQFLAEREVVCDRAALHSLPRSSPGEYGSTLLKTLKLTQKSKLQPALVPFLSRKNELKHRIKMIMKAPQSHLLTQCGFALLAFTLTTLIFTSATADDESRDRPRDGDAVETGPRDGDAPREGARDGDKPKTGPRDDNSPRRNGPRDGAEIGANLRVKVFRDGVAIGDKKFSSMADFRNALRGHDADSVLVAADPNAPFQTVNAVIDALKASGIQRVSLATQRRDGDPPRDDDRPREGARDGDRPREGARDGDQPKIGARDGEGDRGRDGEMRRDGEGTRDREEARNNGSKTVSNGDLVKLTRIYKVYDKDESGGVTFKEWIAMKNFELTSDQEKREKHWFDQADANGDDKITLGEWIDWKSNPRPE